MIARKGASTTQPLLTADRQTLLDSITRQFDAVHDFNADVDMVPALGTAEKSKITEYKDVRAYILFRKPADIRLIGLYPVVRTKAFDMVSNGPDFKLYVPSRNRFLIGKNEIEQPSTNKLENLRPQHFLDALMVRPVDLKTEKVLLDEPHRRGQRLLHHPRGPRKRQRTAAAQPHHLVQPLQPAASPGSSSSTTTAISSPTRAIPIGRSTTTCRFPNTSRSTARATNTPW